MKLTLAVTKQVKPQGRPRVEGGRTRKNLLQIRLSDTELADVVKAANNLEVTPSKLVRMAILEHKVTVPKSYVVTLRSKQYLLEEEEAKDVLKQIANQLAE